MKRNEIAQSGSPFPNELLDLGLAVFGSSEAVFLIREDLIVLANPAASALAGVPLDLLSGSAEEVFARLSVLSEAGDPHSWPDLIESALRGPVHIIVRRPDGSTRRAELRASRTSAEESSPVERALLLTARDITEELRGKELRDEAVAITAHDLRAPLTVIGGYLELLGRNLDEAQRSKAISAASRSVEQMNSLLHGLLYNARAEELLAPASLALVNLSTLAEEVVDSLADTTTHTIRCRCLAVGPVVGEALRLRQAILNLVLNAIRYSPDSGEVIVTVEEREGDVLISVEDTGPGVSEEDREFIFQRFTRLPVGQDSSECFGLGLYIARAVAESHGGRAYVESRDEGPGARFVLALPSAGG